MKKLTSFTLMFFALYAEAQQGTWQVLKTVNAISDCSECGMAAVNGKLYLAGNDGDSAVAVKCFDPHSLAWSALAVAPLIMHHFQPVVLNDKIYILDAFSAGKFPDQVPMANVYSYDVLTNTWERGGEIPADRRRAGAGAAEYKGKLYLVAGIKHGHSSGTNNLFDCYDPVSGKWTSLPDAPHIRDHCFAAVVNNKLYVAGGRNTSFRDPENKIPFFAKTVLDVDVFDFSTGKWSTLPEKLPLGSGGGNLVNLKNVLYYMGGERATDTERNAPRKNTYFFDPSGAGGWIATADLNFARNGMAAAVLNGKIYAAGGSGGPGGPPPGSPDNRMNNGIRDSQPTSGQSNGPPAFPLKKHYLELEVFIQK